MTAKSSLPSRLQIRTKSYLDNLKRARSLRNSVRSSSIGYMGFTAKGNLGDDAIYTAHVRALPGIDFSLLPLGSASAVYRTLAVAGANLQPGVILVGGGTVVGRSEWRQRLTGAMQRLDAPPVFTGVGIEDPGFEGRRAYDDLSELEQWAKFMVDSPLVTVRGPRSRELMEAVGVEAEVVSDPALLLEATVDYVPGAQPVVGVTLAVAGDEGTPAFTTMMQATEGALRQLIARGWRVEFFVFDHRDLTASRSMAAALGPQASVESTQDLDRLMNEIAKCAVVVGQRLHSVVLAAAAYVPSIALEYQPKCRDFQDSIGRGEWVLSVEGLTADQITSLVEEAMAVRDTHAAQLRSAVNDARHRLNDVERRVRAVVEGSDRAALQNQ